MPTTDQLAAAHRQFGAVLATMTPQQWSVSCPCEGWTVGDLVEHLVVGEQMTIQLLDGASREDALAFAHAATVVPADAAAQYAEVAAATEEAFAAPGALERTVQHPVGDVLGEQMLGFRIADFTLHSWDLARSIGGDETLDPALVDAVWTQLQPIAPIIGTIGVFGSGPSGTVPEDAPLQQRLLDLSGRRP